MSLIATVLQDAVIRSTGYFGKDENRLSTYGALQAHVDSTPQLVPAQEIAAAKQSKGRPVKIPILQKFDSTERTARACAPVGTRSTSAFAPLSWATTGFDIIMTMPINADNYIAYQEEFAHQFAMGLKKVFGVLDAGANTFLNTNKSAVNASPTYGALVANTKRIPNAAGLMDFYKRIPSIMQRNDFGDRQVMEIASPEAVVDFEFIGRQGTANGVNSAYQVAGITPYRSNRVLNASDALTTHYIVPMGSIGFLTWNNPLYRENTVVVPNADYFTTMADPIMGFTWDVKYKRECADATDPYTRQDPVAVVERWRFNLDYTFVDSYSSDTSSAIFKYDWLAS